MIDDIYGVIVGLNCSGTIRQVLNNLASNRNVFQFWDELMNHGSICDSEKSHRTSQRQCTQNNSIISLFQRTISYHSRCTTYIQQTVHRNDLCRQGWIALIHWSDVITLIRTWTKNGKFTPIIAVHGRHSCLIKFFPTHSRLLYVAMTRAKTSLLISAIQIIHITQIIQYRHSRWHFQSIFDRGLENGKSLKSTEFGISTRKRQRFKSTFP